MPGKHRSKRSTPVRHPRSRWLRQAGVAGIAGAALVTTAVTQAVAEGPLGDDTTALSMRLEPSALQLTVESTVTEERRAAAGGMSRSADRATAPTAAAAPAPPATAAPAPPADATADRGTDPSTDPGAALQAIKVAADQFAAAEAARIAAEQAVTAEAARIAAEQAAAAEKARIAAERAALANSYVLPTTGYRITGTYGASGMWSSGHSGLDFATAPGTPAVAVHGGTVLDVKSGGNCGRQVRIEHSDGTQVLYCHLSAQSVRTGQQISTGDVIGKVGSTGRSTGPHLHLQVEIGGRTVDPRRWLISHGVTP